MFFMRTPSTLFDEERAPTMGNARRLGSSRDVTAIVEAHPLRKYASLAMHTRRVGSSTKNQYRDGSERSPASACSTELRSLPLAVQTPRSKLAALCRRR